MSDAEARAEAASTAHGDQERPQVAEIEIIKALAAPIRLRILGALTKDHSRPVMSAKELAEELGEPQTKLYRHLKVLQSAGMIEVAATRLVSGILEQRYRFVERDYLLGPGLGAARMGTDAEAAVVSLMRVFAEQFFAAQRAGRLPAGRVPEDEAYREPVMTYSDHRMPPERAAALRKKLREVTDELSGPDDPDGVAVYALIGFYSPAEPGTYPAAEPAEPGSG